MDSLYKFVQYPVDIENREMNIIAKTEHILGERAKLLIDTGAQVSFLCYESIDNKQEINDDLIIGIKVCDCRNQIGNLRNNKLRAPFKKYIFSTYISRNK